MALDLSAPVRELIARINDPLLVAVEWLSRSDRFRVDQSIEPREFRVIGGVDARVSLDAPVVFVECRLGDRTAAAQVDLDAWWRSVRRADASAGPPADLAVLAIENAMWAAFLAVGGAEPIRRTRFQRRDPKYGRIVGYGQRR